MDICLEETLKKKFGAETSRQWYHVPNKMIVGTPKSGENNAAISTRWMLDYWTNSSAFKNWTGFMPSTSKSGATEILKAANGTVQEVDNVPINGFKLVLSDLENSSGYRCVKKLSNCGMLLPNGFTAQPCKQGSKDYIDAIVEVQDPRGWTFYMTASQIISLRSRCTKPLVGLELPGPLVYVFNKSGFTLDYLDGELAKNAMHDEDILKTKQDVVKLRKEFAPEVGAIYIYNNKRLLSLGKLPKLMLQHGYIDDIYDSLFANCLKEVLESETQLHFPDTQTFLKNLMTSAYDIAKKRCGSAAAVVLPWQNVDYKTSISEVKKLLDTNSLWTFVSLGDLSMHTYECDIQPLDKDPYDYIVFGEEADLVNGKDDFAVGSFWRGAFLTYDDSSRIKQLPQKDAADLAMMKKSKNNTLHIAQRKSWSNGYEYKVADVTADGMLEAIRRRIAWLKKVVATFEDVFPTVEPNMPFDIWLATSDKKMFDNLEAIKLLFPCLWKRLKSRISYVRENHNSLKQSRFI